MVGRRGIACTNFDHLRVLLPPSTPSPEDRAQGGFALAIYFSMFINAGAGEGIRTLDPDLGKVVLYP